MSDWIPVTLTPELTLKLAFVAKKLGLPLSKALQALAEVAIEEEARKWEAIE